jgi:aspartate aminotransferase
LTNFVKKLTNFDMISSRAKNLSPSPTLSLNSKVKELKAQGEKIINLTVGEPDFDTPENIKEAGIQAIKQGFSKYAPPAGLSELRQAIAQKFLEDNNISYNLCEITVGVGAKELIYNSLQVLVDPGEEVLIHTPVWNSYIEQIKLAGGIPKLISLDTPFKLTAKTLEENTTEKTKVIILNSPCNPTGSIIDPEELKKIGDLALKKNFYIISDEIYEKIVYGKYKPISIASLSAEIKDRVITINGVSKAYAMTGWRLGYAGGPQEVIKKMVSLEGQTTSGTSAISQKAAVEALTGSQEAVGQMLNKFKQRRQYLIDSFSEMPLFSFTEPEGAFYFYLGIFKVLDRDLITSKDWCEKLLEQERVALVPGEAFESPGYVRLSFAAGMEDLQKAVNGINNFSRCKI